MKILTTDCLVVEDNYRSRISGKTPQKFSTESTELILANTGGWICCKCKEQMYRDEAFCNWNRCNHARCKSCRSFQV